MLQKEINKRQTARDLTTSVTIAELIDQHFTSKIFTNFESFIAEWLEIKLKLDEDIGPSAVGSSFENDKHKVTNILDNLDKSDPFYIIMNYCEQGRLARFTRF